MNIVSFLFLLSAFSSISALIVEAIKKFMMDKENRSYNIIALIVAVVVGFLGTLVYFMAKDQPLGAVNIVFAIIMGITSALVAMTGYDRVVQTIEQLRKH